MSESSNSVSPTVLLFEMTEIQRDGFLMKLRSSYADALFRSGSVSNLALALSRSESQTAEILQSSTEDQYFFRLLHPETSDVLGTLWWTQRKRDQSVWIYDIEISGVYRRRGFARAALVALESWARAHDCPQIGLNVFAYNLGAAKLYQDFGFEDVSKNMRKVL